MSGPVRTFDEARDVALAHAARSMPLRDGLAWAAFEDGGEDDRSYAVYCNEARFVAGGDPLTTMLTGSPVLLVDKSSGKVEEAWYADPSDRARLDAMAPVKG
jgi:hypothetical protein